MRARTKSLFDRVTTLFLADRRGLTLSELGVIGAIARDLESGQADEDRLADLCARIGTTAHALRDHLSDRRRGGSGDQRELFGGSGADPVSVSPRALWGSDPQARAASADRTGYASTAV